MQVIVVGSGKLATELLNSHKLDSSYEVKPWFDKERIDVKSVVVHAGSGRELARVADFCQITASPLIELSTGSEIGEKSHSFPVVLCSNANILMLKFMCMLEMSGHLFRDCQISLVESHQGTKTSVPGTAVEIAQSIGFPTNGIRSVRDPDVQRNELQIPDGQLARHAYHRITIEDGECSLHLESRVYGSSPYADGVSRIIETINRRNLENRLYSTMELVRNGWL
ncbi:dihydrodipicolinate reductase [Paraburkholderia sp. IMGN_8]|uniref:dihydrodipicolinate reductase n=1 Tax=Paraburkholderia sp. IMGN_8 TaxID=3136564 RepID=UPI003100AA94